MIASANTCFQIRSLSPVPGVRTSVYLWQGKCEGAIIITTVIKSTVEKPIAEGSRIKITPVEGAHCGEFRDGWDAEGRGVCLILSV